MGSILRNGMMIKENIHLLDETLLELSIPIVSPHLTDIHSSYHRQIIHNNTHPLNYIIKPYQSVWSLRNKRLNSKPRCRTTKCVNSFFV